MPTLKLSISTNILNPQHDNGTAGRCIILLLFIAVCFLNTCAAPYYSPVNNMGGQPVTLTLANGGTLSGKIRPSSFDHYSTISNNAFTEGVSSVYQTYPLNEIRCLFLHGISYSVKNIKGNDKWGGNALRIVKELTPLNSNLQLFENDVLSKCTNGVVIKEPQLFVQLPGNTLDICNAQRNKFNPNFDVYQTFGKRAKTDNGTPTNKERVKARQQIFKFNKYGNE